MSKIWMYISADKYELPLAIADTATELASLIGKSSHSIKSAVSHYKKRQCNHEIGNRRRYVCVEVEDD